MYQDIVVSDDGSEEVSTPYASAPSSPARLQTLEDDDDDDEEEVERDTLLYGEVRASVPFNWEEAPGKPKLKFSEIFNVQIVAANGWSEATRLSTDYEGCWNPAFDLERSPDQPQRQQLLPVTPRVLPLPPRLKAVKSNNIQIAAADSRAAVADYNTNGSLHLLRGGAAGGGSLGTSSNPVDSLHRCEGAAGASKSSSNKRRVVVQQHRRASSLDSLSRLRLYKPEASSSSFPVQQQDCGEEEKPKDFWRRLFKEKLLRRKTPKTWLISGSGGELLDASWESEHAKKTEEAGTCENSRAAAAAANHLLLNGTEKKLQQSNVDHSQQLYLSSSRSSFGAQSVPRKPVPSIRSPAAISPHDIEATSPITANREQQQQRQREQQRQQRREQQQEREIMFPYNMRLLTSCLGFPPVKTYRSSSSSGFRTLVYGSP